MNPTSNLNLPVIADEITTFGGVAISFPRFWYLNFWPAVTIRQASGVPGHAVESGRVIPSNETATVNRVNYIDHLSM